MNFVVSAYSTRPGGYFTEHLPVKYNVTLEKYPGESFLYVSRNNTPYRPKQRNFTKNNGIRPPATPVDFVRCL